MDRATIAAPAWPIISAIDEQLLWLWFGLGRAAGSSSGARHYLLPCLPPLCVLAALSLNAAMLLRFRARLVATFAVNCALLALVLPLWERRGGAEQFFARQRLTFAAAERVIQYGSNDHGPIFSINRPMAWPRDLLELRRLLGESPRSLLLVSSRRVAEVVEHIPAAEIDRVAEPQSFAERDPRQHWVLLRPSPAPRSLPNAVMHFGGASAALVYAFG